jgi:hypothetical protein
MRDVNESATHPAAAQDHDPDHPPEPGRRRDDPTPPDAAVVNPLPPQRGDYGWPQEAQKRSGVRGDPDPPDAIVVNPLPPQRDCDDPRAGDAGDVGHRDKS